MVGRFPFQKLTKYPHMKPEDVVVWERFIDNNPHFFDSVDYDVPCGKGAPQNTDLPENIQADGKILTQKKIDVVGYMNGVIYVVEVKPTANMRGLGQILTYHELFKADHPEEPKVLKMLICGVVERELEVMYEKHDIILEVVPG